MKLLLLVLLVTLSAGCDEESWEPATLGSSPLVERAEPERVRGESPTGTARMPNLPATLDENQEAAVRQLALTVGQGGGGGGGGGSAGVDLPPQFQEWVDNPEAHQAEAAALLGQVLGAGRNVIGPDVTPCDRLMAMASVASRARGEDELDEAAVRQACEEMGPEVMSCLQPSDDQTETQKRRCRALFGQESALDEVAPEDQRPAQRFRDVREIRAALQAPVEEAPPPSGPRSEPMVVD